MSNGSLHDHLSAMSDAPISWARRLRVARDTACGLAYLHEGMDYSVFNSDNILIFASVFFLYHAKR